MVFQKLMILLIAVLFGLSLNTSSVAQSDRGMPYAYVSGERFLQWPSDAKIHYVAGILDALSYLTETAGIQRGLSDCLKENVIDTLYPITWQLIAKDAVVEAAAKGNAASVSVTKQLFEKMKIVCRDHYPDQ